VSSRTCLKECGSPGRSRTCDILINSPARGRGIGTHRQLSLQDCGATVLSTPAWGRRGSWCVGASLEPSLGPHRPARRLPRRGVQIASALSIPPARPPAGRPALCGGQCHTQASGRPQRPHPARRPDERWAGDGRHRPHAAKPDGPERTPPGGRHRRRLDHRADLARARPPQAGRYESPLSCSAGGKRASINKLGI